MLAEASGGEPQAILLATGSEVSVALAAQDKLEPPEFPPAWCRCPAGSCSRRRTGSTTTRSSREVAARVSVEAGSSAPWYSWSAPWRGRGLRSLCASAPGGTVLNNFGFNADNVVERALAVLHRESIQKARMQRNLSD